MNISRKIMLYAIIAALSIVVFNRVDDVLVLLFTQDESHETVEALDRSYEEAEQFRSEINFIEIQRSFFALDAEFFQVISILGIGMIASIMFRLRE